MDSGCYTALITPFAEDDVDHNGLLQLIKFQVANGITGILAAGTTGESPTLDWNEHHQVIEAVTTNTKGKCLCIAGTGSNNTRESLSATEQAFHVGVDAVLLVDPYYNGPSSLEIRKEYVEPIANAFPDLKIIPYVIPGRTGAQLLPEDLAVLYSEYKNVDTVKEATANLDNMKRTRECCGQGFTILSGDDSMTYKMMADPEINAAGVISVISNIVPKAVADMVCFLSQGNQAEAKNLMTALEPLFNLVSVKTKETTPYGEVVCRARNPLPVKSLMSVLGMPSGHCRQPLGKMTKNGMNVVIDAARSVHTAHPEVFQPIVDFFKVDIDERLNNPSYREDLCYHN